MGTSFGSYSIRISAPGTGSPADEVEKENKVTERNNARNAKIFDFIIFSLEIHEYLILGY